MALVRSGCAWSSKKTTKSGSLKQNIALFYNNSTMTVTSRVCTLTPNFTKKSKDHVLG